jgi:uncharacterized protein
VTNSARDHDAATEHAPVVSVRGDATLEVPPETARLQVSVTSEARDRRAALETLSRRNDDVLALVKSYGDAVERVETRGLSVYPVLHHRDSKRREEKVRFYHGTVRTMVTVADFAVLGELAARLGDMEMTDVQGPWWALRRSSPVYRQARSEAARAAVTRASEYAEAVGGAITALLELADTGLSRGVTAVSRAMRATAQPAGGAAPEPPPLDLEPEEQIVQAQVEARFTMTQPATLRSAGATDGTPGHG